MVMWSEDGSGLRVPGGKHELLAATDECARFTTHHKLTQRGPADEDDVAGYLEEAFREHGAPLVLKQDNGAPLNSDKVRALCDRWGVVLLNSPPAYPPFNGKKERRFRDLKGLVRALQYHGVGRGLDEQVQLALDDLNNQRPRPVLDGRLAREVFEQDRIPLPDRGHFRLEVETRQKELEAQADTRLQRAAARRRAIVEVLSKHKLIRWTRDASTHFRANTGTN
jgi:transposase InsO family protein